MNTVYVALAQINTTVGDLKGNAEKLLRYSRRAARLGAGMVVFPEMTFSGYPPEDLVLKPHFIRDAYRTASETAARLPADIAVLCGLPQPEHDGGRPRNRVLVIQNGQILAHYDKIVLPNYGVFDEQRIFEPGRQALVLKTPAGLMAVLVCEDTWISDGPALSALEGVPLQAIVNLSASPYHRGKGRQRLEMLRRTAKRFDAAMIYCNLVGGQDELLFDGDSMALDSGGNLLARARSFEEQLLTAAMPLHGRPLIADRPAIRTCRLEIPVAGRQVAAEIADRREDEGDIYRGLVMGLRDYAGKNGFEEVLVALSGGIDSALLTILAVDAVGSKHVKTLTMPSQFTSRETLADARLMARRLGTELFEIPIADLFSLSCETLRPVFGDTNPGSAEENLQARLRGMLAMALSNKFGWLLLAAGNKSELATGYCTLYGDMAGGFSPLKDVTKTAVFALARHRNGTDATPPIPESILTRPPSAELRPQQRDTDSLPPYEQLDSILGSYVEQNLGFERIVAEGHDPETVRRVIRMVDRSEHKRRQGPPGIKISPLAFGRDRRMPITNSYREDG